MTSPSERELKRALAKLEKSATRLTRKRARVALRSAVNALLKEHPLLDSSGEEQKSKKRPCCPVCKAPMKSWALLAIHLRKHCGPTGVNDCPCCKEKFAGLEGVWKHLAALHRQGKLVDHVMLQATQQALLGEPNALQFYEVTATRNVEEAVAQTIPATSREDAWEKFLEQYYEGEINDWETQETSEPEKFEVAPLFIEE